MIDYLDIKPQEISLIKEVWICNKEFHEEIDENFTSQYASLDFETRMNAIVQSGKNLKISIAKKKNCICAYCISSIENHKGEIESLHVLESERGNGIGKKLTQMHLNWLKSNHCEEIGLYVASCNEKTIDFYKELGLLPNLTYMQLKDW
ncbi:GNAT family N-acetyltransferase [Marinifilum flexuosum]|uniref:GNAT family N-acetyltransferase n=1 Tax=Marinifilum flexuosum TaxID=1117708 RepID=UPI0024948D14|nr:GNAT family N-acetyltransferase [Marinifilum flexuosum]